MGYLTPVKITEKTPYDELKRIAEQMSNEIFRKISEQTDLAKKAKVESEEAEKMKSGGFLNIDTNKKTDRLAKVVVDHSDLHLAMNDLLQEAVTLSCMTTKFAAVVKATLTDLLENGFRDVKGSITEVSADTAKFMKSIMQGADNFIKQQTAAAEGQKKLEKKLKVKDVVDEAQNVRLSEVEQQLEQMTKAFFALSLKEARARIDECIKKSKKLHFGGLKLDLSHLSLTDEGVYELFKVFIGEDKALGSITEINFSGNDQLTKVPDCVVKCIKLKKLVLSGTNAKPPKGFRALEKVHVVK